MRKWVYLILLLLMMPMLLGACGMMPDALAEAATGTNVTFDATPIVAGGIVLIGVTLGAVLLWLTYKYLVPLLKVPIVGTLAKWAVDLAEQTLDSGNGEAKFGAASAYMVRVLGTLHIVVDQEQIKAAIVSAWTALNLGQIAAGVKDAAGD